MIRKEIIIQILLLIVISCSSANKQEDPDKYLNPDKIETLKIQPEEMPYGFVLFQERLSKPLDSTNEQVSQIWQRESIDQDLKLIEESKQAINKSTVANFFQIWYSIDENGKKNKIEFDVVICLIDSIMQETITYYTKDAYAFTYILMEKPLIGDKNWIPAYNSQDSYSLMFLKYNVFVRIYTSQNNKDADEIKELTETLAKKIEDKIDL